MEYVTYNEAGALTGGFSQELHASHEAAHIEVTAEQRHNWTAYQANAARDGVELAPVVTPPPVVPQQVAMWQAREILIDDGLLDDVYAYFETITDPVAKRKAISKFDTSNTVQRNDPLVLYVIPLMGKSEAEIDQMFVRAAEL
ncbi:hypothetical protein HHL21_12295 [Massilia sp. RP-1-19]|uniref:Uncharacterized protein n=1 Tax=Massilia polaris TaxID=2728846 RepID=A0A848HPV9_9BURK|nr:hypothetical protein [Massilia polaris]NML61841.1 hypothetical protein [Massilia polaris]